ncbi:MAG: immunoglobulin-like domain-containing protein [Candidatus Thiodiazotropha sp. 6PLUC1]
MLPAVSSFGNAANIAKVLTLKSLLLFMLLIFLNGCGSGGGDSDQTDTTPPEITLLGANPIEIDVSASVSFTDPGATASDDSDGDISDSIVIGGDAVDTSTPGTYLLTYDVNDAAGNAATQLIRRVMVIDTTPPEIVLLGENPVEINLSACGAFTEPGATASDNVDGDISENIVISGEPVDMSTPGSYILTYDVSDASGNAAIQLTRNVVVIDDQVVDPAPAALPNEWVWRNPLPRGNSLKDITWNGELLVAVGNNGTILTSRDILNWDEQDSGTLTTIQAITWTGSQFVAVGGDNWKTGLVLTSPDGIIWRVQNQLGNRVLYDVIWDGNQLIAVSTGGSIYSSRDGVEWSHQEPLETSSYYAIEWTGERYIAGGTKDYNRGLISTSVDGISWNHIDTTLEVNRLMDLQQPLVMGIQPQPSDIVWTGNQVVVVGTEGLILTSPDGLSWTKQDAGTTGWFSSVTWTGTQLVAINYGDNDVYTSEDGVSWAPQHADSSSGIIKSIWSGSEIVAVGYLGVVASSTDGISWRKYNDPNSLLLDSNDVVWNGTKYVAVGNSGRIVSSCNGIDWMNEDSATDLDLNRVIWADEGFFAVGEGGVIISSPDGSNWTVVEPGVPIEYGIEDLYDIAWSGSRFVAIGIGGRIVTSENGVDWSEVDRGDFYVNYIKGIVWTGTEFVTVGSRNPSGISPVFSSPDGLNWRENSTRVIGEGAFQDSLVDISFNGEQFVALPEYNDTNIYISNDGVNWYSHEQGVARNGISVPLRHTLWTGSKYLGVGRGVIASSEDGIAWTVESTITDNYLDGIAVNDRQAVVVGWGNTIISTIE